MENIQDKAREYAEGKGLSAIDSLVAQAYADGYRNGYDDKSKAIITDVSYDDGEFVDLGLPSGTLWSAGYAKELEGDNLLRFTYREACNKSIPTVEQWKELIENCQWTTEKGSTAICLGPNDKYIVFEDKGYDSLGTSLSHYFGVAFWIKGNGTQNVAEIHYSNGKVEPMTEDLFPAYKLAVRLVRNK